MPEPTFSIQDLLKFQNLHKKLEQLQLEISEIDKDLLLLKQKKEQAEKARDEINSDLTANYKELTEIAKKTSLFTFFQSGSEEFEKLEIESPNYVHSSEKEMILTTMLSNYRRLYPDHESVPFTWIKHELKQRYGIETKSISNFFVGILDNYELLGGNRNRSISLKGLE